MSENNTSNQSDFEIRKEKVEKLRALKIEPWPELSQVNCRIKDILKNSDDSEKVWSVSGRMISRREHGKSAFALIKDGLEQIQIYLKQDLIGSDQFDVFLKLLDIGDILWVKGTTFLTKTGQITLKVSQLKLQSKCLRPIAEKYHGLNDVETRYRQRYLDLISNQQSMERFKKRSQIVSQIRNFLNQMDFIEVETPMLHPISGGALARPFKTHHNAYNMELFLRIAPELYLKRLIVGDMDRVFEINRNFRNEGISTRHNPEFTMLEFYMAYGNYKDGIKTTQELLRSVIEKTCSEKIVDFGDKKLDFSKSFEVLSVQESLIKIGGLDKDQIVEKNIDAVFHENKIKLEGDLSLGEKQYILFENLVESKIVNPTFITHYPIEVSPLAKKDPDNPNFAARFELFAAGMELANGYTELNDPIDQAKRFSDQEKKKSGGDLEAHETDHDYVKALEYGMAPTVGVGIGIDRLTMLLTDTTSIKDVILFPTLKNKN